MSWEAAFYVLTKNGLPSELFEEIHNAIYELVQGRDDVIYLSSDQYQMDGLKFIEEKEEDNE